MAPHSQEPMAENVTKLDEPKMNKEYPIIYKPAAILLQVVLHGFSLYALIFKLHHMKILTIMYAIFLTMLAILGVTGGAHRLWCHRSFSATWPLKLFLCLCFSLSGHASIFDWVQIHRLHHKYTDTDADPHNSRRGIFFSHLGWLMRNETAECKEKVKEIDMSDILKDPIATFQTRYFYHISYALFFLPALIPVYVWGEDVFLSILATGFLKTTGCIHAILSINSFAHMFGTKPYNKKIQPVESAILSFFAMGEGWHNYHHTFPWDYKAAEFGERFNLTARFIHLCGKLGLAYNLKTVSPEQIASMKEKYGDGSDAHH